MVCAGKNGESDGDHVLILLFSPNILIVRVPTRDIHHRAYQRAYSER